MTLGPPSKSQSILRVSIVLPFPLPTRNQMNSLAFRDRLKVKAFIRDTVSKCIQDAGASRTPTGLTLKAQSTAFAVAEYLKMIRPNTATRPSTRKKNVFTKKL